jgi:hypothetical protein
LTNEQRDDCNDPKVKLISDGYTSEILQQFIHILQRRRREQILDTGPVCTENIMFFAQRMKRLYVCDMFLRLDRELRAGRDPAGVRKHLDYPASYFDGIQLWDFCDHLPDRELVGLLRLCHALLNSEGLLMFTAFEEPIAPVSIHTFVIGHDFRINFRFQRHLKLPWYCRHNRALMSLLENFRHLKSFRYRNGIREFLFEKPHSRSAR